MKIKLLSLLGDYNCCCCNCCGNYCENNTGRSVLVSVSTSGSIAVVSGSFGSRSLSGGLYRSLSSGLSGSLSSGLSRSLGSLETEFEITELAGLNYDVVISLVGLEVLDFELLYSTIVASVLNLVRGKSCTTEVVRNRELESNFSPGCT